MAQQVGDYVVQRLNEWGVEEVFSYPGDGINGLVAAFGRAETRPTFVQARHEEMAAFSATGFAKFSGKVGVCMATSGPGAIHLLNGLYDAKLDHVPVVAIIGQTARSAMGGHYQQEVDLQSLYKDVASEYLVEVNVSEQLPNALDRAFRTAWTRKTPTAVIIPADLQEEPYEPPQHAFKQVPSSPPAELQSVVIPARSEIERAAEVIRAGSKVAILVGQGARAAVAEVKELAEITGAGIAKALLGKDVLPDDLPYVTGPIGLLGTRPSYELMRDCDTLVFVEVRYRASAGHGGGAESVDRTKRRKLVRAAGLFLLQHPAFAESYCRFDVVDATGDPEAPDFTWHRAAFRADDA